MFYLLQTQKSVAFCGTVDEVYSALSNRPVQLAILHTADDFETLRHLAAISQNRFIECNADKKNPIERIALPTTVTEQVCLQANEHEGSISWNLITLSQTGEWAISALNGFCTAPDDITLCQLLDADTLAYPVARWFESSHENVVNAARQNYVKRFYTRYWYNAEQSFLPQCWLECFQDRYFQEREKRRKASLPEEYEKFQLTQMAMGW